MTINPRISDIQANQNQKEVTANAAFNLLDRAENDLVEIAVAGNFQLTEEQQWEYGAVRLTGTPGAAFTMDMADALARRLVIVNDTDSDVTVRNSAGGGSTVTIANGQASLLHYDGTDLTEVAGTGAGGSAGSTGAANILLNGEFLVAQQGTTFDASTTPANDDDTYTLDQWVLLSDGNDVVDVAQITTGLPDGARAGVRLTVATANLQFGLVQIVEAADCRHVIGQAVSLSAQLQLSAGLAKVRMAVLSWTGTEDAPTTDVVGTWAGGGTEPTWATNWVREGAIVDVTTTGAWTEALGENIAVDTASTKQVAVVIWLDDTDATVGDTLDVSMVQLEAGATAGSFEFRHLQRELALCQRFFERIAPDTGRLMLGNGQTFSTSSAGGPTFFKVPKRVVPTITTSAASTFEASNPGGSAKAASTVTLNVITQFSTNVQLGGTAGSDLAPAGGAANIFLNNGHLDADARF